MGKGGRSLGIFWDVKSCPIPEGVNPPDVVKNIYAALRPHFPDYVLQVFLAYGDPSDFPTHLLPTWERDGMKIRDVGGGYRLYKQLALDVMSLALAFEHTSSLRPALVLISADQHHQLLFLTTHGYPRALVIPSTDPTSVYFRHWSSFSLLDWLSFARGSAEIMNDQRSIDATVADDEGGSSRTDQP